jgi:ATP-dependent DNA ligase
MAPSLSTSLRSLLWHARVQERESSELGLQHVPSCKAFDLAGRQVPSIGPKSTRFSPSALHPSAAFPAGREATSGPQWLHEIKLDGYRMAARIDKGRSVAPRRAPSAVRASPTLPAGREAPFGPQWVHEIKLDGYRMAARIDNGCAQLLSRTGLAGPANIRASSPPSRTST